VRPIRGMESEAESLGPWLNFASQCEGTRALARCHLRAFAHWEVRRFRWRRVQVGMGLLDLHMRFQVEGRAALDFTQYFRRAPSPARALP